MPAKLTPIVQIYLNDTEYQEERKRITQSRNDSMVTLRRPIESFIQGTTDLGTLRTQINNALPDKETWGARGSGFLMELNKLAKNHYLNPDGSKNEAVENKLREILRGLDAQTLGVRIEDMYIFLLAERARFKQEGRARGSNASPGNSAMLVSLFAHWRDWTGDLVIYYLSLRQGIKKLLDYHLLKQIEGLRIAQEQIMIQSNADHQAVMRAIHEIAESVPQLKSSTGAYWAERFFLWITNNPEVLNEEESKDQQPAVRYIEHRPLRAIPEERLRERIAQLQSTLLVDEKVVRRIYHALLAGNVILTGPPGTGKTALAQALPEILWNEGRMEPQAYTTILVTATDEWSVRTLIGGLAPRSVNGQVIYSMQYGHLTEAIRKNWAYYSTDVSSWGGERNTIYVDKDGEGKQEFRGLWLIIDEFNRAPIDLALGDALTALSNGNGGKLRIPTDDGTHEMTIPQDFRIIGTLNSFDRNYLNQISEALKRRFSFIEILPPTRAQAEAEKNLAFFKAIQSIMHISDEIKLIGTTDGNTTGEFVDFYTWRDLVKIIVSVDAFPTLPLSVWLEEPMKIVLNQAWKLFEVIRIYRQLGTAQAIALLRHALIAIVTQGFIEEQEWLEAMDAAYCDTIADQLQVLLPDELDVLYAYVKQTDNEAFWQYYQALLGKQTPRRKLAQLEALSMVVGEDGVALLSEEQGEKLRQESEPKIDREVFRKIFRLGEGRYVWPQFAQRLRTLKAERGV